MRKSAASTKKAPPKGAEPVSTLPAPAVAKPGSEELVEAEILLADDRKVTLKVFFTEEHQSKVRSWLVKQVADPKGSSTLKLDMKTIASGG